MERENYMTEEEAKALEEARLKLEMETKTLEKEQASQPTEDQKKLSLLENTILEEREARQKLEARLEELLRKPAETPEEKDKKFYASPTSQLDEIVAKQIAPLKDFIGELRAGSALDQAKSKIKKDPKFSKVFEVAPDEMEESINRLPKDLSQNDLEASIRGIARGVAGAIVMGELGDKKLTMEPKVNDRTPAHLRPSSAHFSKREDDAKVEMTEDERFLAKKQGISEEDWVELRDADSRSFVHTKKKEK